MRASRTTVISDNDGGFRPLDAVDRADSAERRPAAHERERCSTLIGAHDASGKAPSECERARSAMCFMGERYGRR